LITKKLNFKYKNKNNFKIKNKKKMEKWKNEG